MAVDLDIEGNGDFINGYFLWVCWEFVWSWTLEHTEPPVSEDDGQGSKKHPFLYYYFCGFNNHLLN